MKIHSIFFLFVFYLTGCDNPFAPRLDSSPPNSTSILADQHQLEGVFHNFKQAYAFQDSTIYGEVLAPNFIFTYPDYNNHGIDVFWGRDEEIRTTYGLFQNVQRLDLVWNSIKVSSIDSDSLKATITRNFNLTVTFSANDIVRINGDATWTLERLQTSENWKITRWRDVSNY